LQLPKQLGSDIDGDGFPLEAFLSIGFTQHVHIITKIKDYNERLFYIKRCASEHYTVDLLKRSIISDDYHHQANLPNNFFNTLPAEDQAFRAVNTFKDEYLLDYINVEEAVILENKASIPAKTGPVPVTECTRKFYGATYLLDRIDTFHSILSGS